MMLASLSVSELRQKLVAREVSPVEALDAVEQRIVAVDDRSTAICREI
jgi:Asp-tRNA(Asn)/Glu-tRNA(Gln) amidotransferase A subunit family amidase